MIFKEDKKERGDTERKCLEHVKKHFFCYKERNYLMMRGLEKFPLKENNFSEDEIRLFIQSRRNSFCGMVFEDIKEFFTALENAIENPKLSEFPDFVFDNGFIEHFKVTSSKETSKGSKKEKLINNFEKNIKAEVKNFEEYCEKNVKVGESYSENWGIKDTKHCYENLEKSIKRQLDKHLKSLDKYNGKKNLNLFMIEYGDFGIEMIEDCFRDYDETKKLPKRKQQYHDNYKLSCDKNMLNYIYQFKDKIDYIIYDPNLDDEVEVIKVKNIPKIIENIPFEYVFEGKINYIEKRLENIKIGFNLSGEINE